MAFPDNPQGGLSYSLYGIYQKCKASTSTIVDWLVARNTSQSKNTQHPRNQDNATTELPVRKLLELAQATAQRSIKPPANIHNAFKVASFNLHDASHRYKYFNETLAQAYDALFPGIKIPRHAHHAKKPAKNADQDEKTKPSANLFDVLSSLIETEADADIHDYVPPAVTTEEKTGVTERYSFEDDPREDFSALHTSVLEVESIISLVNETWASAAKGSVPICVAATLTNLGFRRVREVASFHWRNFGTHDDLANQYNIGVPVAQGTANGTAGDETRTLENPAPARIFDVYSVENRFGWSTAFVNDLFKMKPHLRPEFMKLRNVKLRDFLRSPEEEAQAKQEFSAAVRRLAGPPTSDPSKELQDSKSRYNWLRMHWKLKNYQSIHSEIDKIVKHLDCVPPDSLRTIKDSRIYVDNMEKRVKPLAAKSQFSATEPTDSGTEEDRPDYADRVQSDEDFLKIMSDRFHDEVEFLHSAYRCTIRMSRHDGIHNTNRLLRHYRTWMKDHGETPADQVGTDTILFQPADSVPLLEEFETFVNEGHGPQASSLSA